MPITVRPLPSLLPNDPQSHHIGTPPTGFRNPWPSFTETHHGLLSVLKVRFAKGRPAFVPVPSDRSELVPVHKIDFAALQSDSDPGNINNTNDNNNATTTNDTTTDNYIDDHNIAVIV
ncbi:hypothetical protein ABEF95_011632 [Exophiala dermatitidis]